jgi:hypothetical protein
VLFALTLLGVATIHHHTLKVALTGALVITLYQLAFTGFKTGVGLPGLWAHAGHEWVTLANLLGLLLGFALLANHFERSHFTDKLPHLLPDDWKGGFLLLVIVFVMSGFLDNIAAAMIGGTIASGLFKRRVHIGYIAAIVAASNAGGAGSVVGDTTTTMMWIAGANPLWVLEAYIGGFVALMIFGSIAAMKQHDYQPIQRDDTPGERVHGMRLGIVAFILLAAIGVNIWFNLNAPDVLGQFPVIGTAVLVAILVTAPIRSPDWSLLPGAFKGSIFLLALVWCASLMPVQHLPAASWPTALGGVRQHSAHGAGHSSGRLRLGLPGVCRGLRGFDDLVRLVGRRRDIRHLSGGPVGVGLARGGLAHCCRLCRGLHGDVGGVGLAPSSDRRACGRAACSNGAHSVSLSHSDRRAVPRRPCASTTSASA